MEVVQYLTNDQKAANMRFYYGVIDGSCEIETPEQYTLVHQLANTHALKLIPSILRISATGLPNAMAIQSYKNCLSVMNAMNTYNLNVYLNNIGYFDSVAE
jgi:hypothetical protein